MKRIIILLTMFAGMVCCYAQGALSAQQVLDKATEAIAKAGSLEIAYSVNSGGKSGNGSLFSFGNKFKLTLPDVKVWYNGKDMYTYNSQTKETTLMIPTSEEVSEVNPLQYIKNWKKDYTASFSTEKKNGKYIVDLLPKIKNSTVKKVTVTINARDFMPEKFTGEPVSGSSVSILISSLKKGVPVNSSDFEYPKSLYPKVEIIDLR